MQDSFPNVNRYGVLSPPLLLIVILLLETQHWWILLLTTVSARKTPQVGAFLGDFSWIFLAVELPALLVLGALTQRTPGAGRFIRMLWRHGRTLTSTSAVIALGLIGYGLLQSDYWSLNPEYVLLTMAGLHIWALLRIWLSPLIAQVFEEFPLEEVASPKKP